MKKRCFVPFIQTSLEIHKLTTDYEFVFVNDGSKDDTLNILRDLASADSSVHYISFSRNFGKEAAMLAGLKYATGDAIVIMDADLQHPPTLIKELLEGYNEGYDQVIAKEQELVIHLFALSSLVFTIR